MSRTIKRMTAILLSVILMTTIFTALPFTANAVITKSGTTGDCTWTLDDAGTLTISGNGYMDSYLSEEVPWGKDITALIIEDGVKDISNYAFADCTKLKSAKIGNGMQSIYMFAFENCTALETIEFPDSLEYLSEGVFSDTAWFKNQPNGLVYAGKVAYKYKGKMTTYTTIDIIEGTKSICAAAFNNCKYLIGVNIPDSVNEIGGNAFRDTTLISVTIPDSVHEIKSSTFMECESLSSVTLGKNVNRICDSAFEKCKTLASIDIPSSVETIEPDAFRGCRSMQSITIPETVKEIGEGSIGYDDWYNDNRIPGFTIYGVKGSAAETYANDNSIPFVEIEPQEPATEPTTVEPTTVEPTTAEPTTVDPTTEPAPAVMVGDVNGDNVVNGADAGVLNRYASGWAGYADKIKNMTAADINGDGKVNGADAGILARYTSGWKQYAKFFN